MSAQQKAEDEYTGRIQVELRAALDALQERDAEIARLKTRVEDAEGHAMRVDQRASEIDGECQRLRDQLGEARALLQRVKADRPSVHPDDLWLDICAFLASTERVEIPQRRNTIERYYAGSEGAEE